MRIGLVERILPAKELWNAAMEMARTISENAPLAVYAAKLTISKFSRTARDRDMDAIRKIGDVCMDSEDFREGRRAFMEKRSRNSTANKILLCDPPALPQAARASKCVPAQRSASPPARNLVEPALRGRRARISYAPMVPAVRWGLHSAARNAEGHSNNLEIEAKRPRLVGKWRLNKL